MTAGCPANCGNANKNWVDAYIQITPQNAANAVGTHHTLTITVTATNGGLLAAGTATASILDAAEHDRELLPGRREHL